MKKLIALTAAFAMCISMNAVVFAAEPVADNAVIEISTAEELAAVNDNLSGNYILTADIDLGGEEWTPIGSFLPEPVEEGEEPVVPGAEYAFTGTFDGNGHTISNLVINQPENYTLGLFGCIANADVGNFTLDHASAGGCMMVSCVVGYSYCSVVHDISLTEGKVTAYTVEGMEEASEGMYGGIVGAGMASSIVNCSADADMELPDGLANAGIVGGGLELTSVIGCQATGTISAGNTCYGLGGISGCGFGAEEFTDNTASDVLITAGDDCFWIGGITGYAGGYEDESFGVPVTVFTNCHTSGVTIQTGNNADGVDALVGAGFYSEQAAEMMGAPYDQPAKYELVDCSAEDAEGGDAQEGSLLYGTMDIPFALFYAQEGPSYEVDAVSSATNSKWFSDSLATGGYSVKHENDEGGDILGVTYPVAVSASDLEALGEDNFNFTAMEDVPQAYKTVALEEGQAVFSAVQGATQPLEVEATLTTNTVWGDYEIDINAINNADGTSDIGPIYGAMLTTEDGAVYAMRQLENIWRDELSWSSGIYTVEPHGNVMSSEHFADLMGKTITAITYITDSGYHVIDTSLYVPVKFVGSVTVEEAAADAGSSAVTFENFPEDYAMAYDVEGLDFEMIEDQTLTWETALAGAYTLVVSDTSGKYADLNADFVLTTDTMPAAYDAEANALVAADDADSFGAFLANINTVTVNGTAYGASGRGAVAIIDADGLLDTEAVQVKGHGPDAEQIPVFPEPGDYEVSVEANGFTTPLNFTVTVN